MKKQVADPSGSVYLGNKRQQQEMSDDAIAAAALAVCIAVAAVLYCINIGCAQSAAVDWSHRHSAATDPAPECVFTKCSATVNGRIVPLSCGLLGCTVDTGGVTVNR